MNLTVPLPELEADKRKLKQLGGEEPRDSVDSVSVPDRVAVVCTVGNAPDQSQNEVAYCERGPKCRARYSVKTSSSSAVIVAPSVRIFRISLVVVVGLPFVGRSWGPKARRELAAMGVKLIAEAVGPDYLWPWEGDNYKVVGGCSVHFGSNTFLQHPEDIHFYREASGVNWTYGDFLPAIQEIEEMFNVGAMPEGTWCKAVHLFNEAARSMGFDPFPTPVSRKNCLDCGFCGSGHLCRYDSKGNSLWGAYIGLNNGLKIIANSTVEKILIENVPGRGPVATGVIYTDRNNQSHEVRAARVIVACGTNGTPLLMFKSGYGPRRVLGSNLIVENLNVGENLDGDSSFATEAMWSEPIRPAEGMTGFTMFTTKPHPYPEMTVQFRGTGLTRQDNSNKFPHLNAIHGSAPQFGWKHKEFMKRKGWLQFGSIKSQMGTIPWKWRVTPDGKRELVSMDEARINAVRQEAADLAVALYEKMPLKPVKVVPYDVARGARRLRPGHNLGSCRAGGSRDVAVCDSDFNCFDIENLMFTSGASIPRSTFCHGCGPIAVGAAFAWRRILANHFTPGSSTKDFA